MSAAQKFYGGLAILVVGFYIGLTYLPQILGTCLDAECGFSVSEIVVSMAVPLVFIALPVLLEMVIYRKGLSQALSDIGVTRFSWTGIRLAIVFLIPLMAFFPILSLLTNSPVTLQTGWEWQLLRVILVNGFAEEILMRGFVFRHLRTGRSFWRAAALATAYFALYHLPLVVAEGVVVGSIAVVIAIPLGFLTAYVYERGHNTIWGPILVHVGINGLVMLLVFTSDVQPLAGTLYLLVGIAASTGMLVYAHRKGYGRSVVTTRSETVPAAA